MSYEIGKICLFLVGSIFVITGIAKVLEPWKFITHIASLDLVKLQWIKSVSLIFIALETALGIALILQVLPDLTILGSVIILFGLSLLTYWSTSTGKTKDCGCYNGLLEISPNTSLLLNALYILLLIFAWVYRTHENTVLWQYILTIISFIVSGALASGQIEYYIINGRPYFDLTSLKVNRQWQSQWLEGAIDVSQGSKIVVFLSPECPQCKNWLKILRLVHYRADLPEVVGVVNCNVEAAKDYAKSYNLNFSIVVIKPFLFNKLAMAVPTAVVLENGVIKEKWVGTMPQKFVAEIASGSRSIPKGSGLVLTAHTNYL
ncbi:MAG: MauE/DoxX family redox-associated membrane protein [Nostoc sp.]|uniref:MauE/DoxX family redox-associated membrane protein n=1 Tax=Nostoc sp. TaxID=1180 RepID=UPI002FF1DEFE